MNALRGRLAPIAWHACRIWALGVLVGLTHYHAAAQARDVQAPAAHTAAAPFVMREIAHGVHVHVGEHALATADNAGAIAASGFIVGERCVAVIDTGGSRRAGDRLRAAVRKVTPRPICYVINTHVHPDHIFGNAAFEADRPIFVGHRRLAAAMAARGANYQHALERDLGPAAAGSRVIAPTLVVQDKLDLDLGARVLTLRAWPTAHTDNDLTVFDATTATLWLSDLLFVGHLPVVDGSLTGWLAVLDDIGTLAPDHVVAGHGTGDDWRRALAQQQRYLRGLRDETRAAIKAGRTLEQAVATVGLSERGHWQLFEDFHRRNVTAAYAELEWED